MTFLIVMLEFKDLYTSIKVQMLICPIIIVYMLLVIDMATLIHMLIGIHSKKTLDVALIPSKAKLIVTMLVITIQRKWTMVIHSHLK